jgi:predicted aspartyl protease
MDVHKCWAFEEELKIYRIPLRITNIASNISMIKYCLFDTGFSGYIALDSETIQALKLPQKGTGNGITVGGQFNYNNYAAKVELVDENQETIAVIKNVEEDRNDTNELMIQEFTIPIIGIRAINQFSWLVLSERKVLCLLK